MLAVDPALETARADNALLRDEVVRLLTEVREVLDVERPHVLARYQVELGPSELHILSLTTQIARTRRKISLFQAALNRRAQPDEVQIEAELDREHAAWTARIRDAEARIEVAQDHFRAELASREDVRELRRLFRELVRALHPDLNGELTAPRRALWERVLVAHERGDLDELQALAIHARGDAPEREILDSRALLEEDNARLKRRIDGLLEELARLRREPPLNLRAQLEDEAWTRARREELARQATTLGEELAGLEIHLATLGGKARGNAPHLR